MIIIELATSKPYLSQVREMFREYQGSLDVDLCFQDFEYEFATLPGKYAPPQGRIYLAFVDGEVAGCIALRPLQAGQCEMKRLYVRTKFRGRNLARILANRVIAAAREIGYTEMFLDTLSSMVAAQTLYLSLGFEMTGAYCFNPVPGSLYMKLDLQAAGFDQSKV